MMTLDELKKQWEAGFRMQECLNSRCLTPDECLWNGCPWVKFFDQWEVTIILDEIALPDREDRGMTFTDKEGRAVELRREGNYLVGAFDDFPVFINIMRQGRTTARIVLKDVSPPVCVLDGVEIIWRDADGRDRFT